MQPRTITSDDLIDIEQHFKVTAGPGAGKTYWLVKHIKNVLQNSRRLGKSKKIACITFTNAAAEMLQERLGQDTDRVEVSTLHSFLYRNVVKPYSHLLSPEFELNTELLDGHEDHIVTYSKVKDWIGRIGSNFRYLIEDFERTKKYLETLKWKFEGDASSIAYEGHFGGYQVPFRKSFQSLGFLSQSRRIEFLEYKKLFWKEGRIHHEDVIFFAFELFRTNPKILDVLVSRFPYLFVDEFQDNAPIQISFIKRMGCSGSVVGVIGDVAQSIYKFLGAAPQDFATFSLLGMLTFEIHVNRRSSKKIINFLNKLRPELQQHPLDESIDGELATLLVGDKLLSLSRCLELSLGEPVCSLAFQNEVANYMMLDGTPILHRVIDKIAEADPPQSANRYRSRRLVSLAKAIEYSRRKRFKEALKEIEKAEKGWSDRESLRKEALRRIGSMLEMHSTYATESLLEFARIARDVAITDIPKIKGGEPARFYSATSYKALVAGITIPDDRISLGRTIHKAKGDEYPNVLVVLPEENLIECYVNPDLRKEDHRLYYVAASRAMNRLFINVPTLNIERRSALAGVMNIIDL